MKDWKCEKVSVDLVHRKCVDRANLSDRKFLRLALRKRLMGQLGKG